MAFPTMQYQYELTAQRFANALYDVQLGSETLDYVVSDFETYGVDPVLNSYYDFSFGNMAVADVAATLVANMGIVVGENNIDQVAYDAALAYVEGELNAADADARGAKTAEIIEFWSEGFQSAAYDDAIAAFNAEVETAMEYNGEADVAVGTDTVVTDFTLTAGQDILTGSASDDYFDAPLAQNSWAGGVSNTLSSSDSLDGAAGDDVLNADLVPEFFGASGDNQMDIQPRIQNIETIELEAKDFNDEVGDDQDEGVIFDAKDVTDVENIGSYYSDGDLVIENLTTLTSDGAMRNTDAITITMDHTDNFNSDEDASDLHVYFDEDYLLSGQTAESFVEYFLLDQDADLANTDVDGDGNEDLLANINANGIRLSVDGGDEVVIEFDKALLENDSVITHQDFVDALQQPLQDLIDAGELPSDTTLTLDNSRTRTTFLDDGSVSSQIPAILIQTQTAAVFEAVGFAWVEDLVGDYNVFGRMNDDATVSNEPVAINVDLHKVGRDNQGGDLFIGGKADEGIPNIHIDVLGDDSKPSDLGSISTNENDLQNVYIETHADYVGGETFASLTVRDGFDDQSSVNLVDADDFLGDLTLGSANAVDDLVTLTAQGGGDVSFTGLVDAIGNAYSYTTGSGDDTVSVTLDGDAVDTIGESFAIDTNAGDDTVMLTMDSADQTGVSQETMAALDNLSIATDAGEDTVELIGYGNFHIATGSSSDYVYINSIDDTTSADAAKGAWTNGEDGTGATQWVDRVLYSATLTVNFAGFEQQVDIDTDASGNFIADQITINEAIMDAIDSNPELSKLLSYTLGTGEQALTINSTVEGNNDLVVTVDQPEVVVNGAGAGQVDLAAGDVGALGLGLIETGVSTSDDVEDATEVVGQMGVAGALEGNLDNTGAANADFIATGDGTDGVNETTVINNSTINLGSGANDLVVLNSDDDSAQTLEFTSTWGKVSVVNFFTDQAATEGNHILDFTAWLDDMNDPSATANTDSAVRFTTTSTVENSASIDLTANEVAIVNDFAEAGTETWDSLTASLFEAALDDVPNDNSNDYANISDGAITAGANLIGDTQDSIVLIQNDQNAGEYKVFNVEADTTAAANTDDQFEVSYLGVVDFGATIDADVAVA